MAEYVVYVDVDLIHHGTLRSVTTTFARCGFVRAMRREKKPVPLPSLLFIGNSHFDELQLAQYLEEQLRLGTMCDVRVIVFQLAKLRSRLAVNLPVV